MSVHSCDRGPPSQGPQASSRHMPGPFNHCRGWHLIPAVYFCACPSATNKMLLWVELMCWNGECQYQVVCVIVYLHSWPLRGAWNQERKGALDAFAPTELDKTQNRCRITEAAREFGLVLGPYGENVHVAVSCSCVPPFPVYRALPHGSHFVYWAATICWALC